MYLPQIAVVLNWRGEVIVSGLYSIAGLRLDTCLAYTFIVYLESLIKTYNGFW